MTGNSNFTSGLSRTKIRGFPEGSRGKTRPQPRENPDTNRVNFSSRLFRFWIRDRRAILIERNIVNGFPASARAREGSLQFSDRGEAPWPSISSHS